MAEVQPEPKPIIIVEEEEVDDELRILEIERKIEEINDQLTSITEESLVNVYESELRAKFAKIKKEQAENLNQLKIEVYLSENDVQKNLEGAIQQAQDLADKRKAEVIK